MQQVPAGSADDVLHEVDELGVATVTLNRPDRLNAMTPGMQRRYCGLLAELDRDPAVRAIVITGAGRGFCAGADLAVLEGTDLTGFDPDGDEPVDLAAPLRLGTPSIAAVNGPVAGMGFSYMLMADLRYAADTARIGSTFARLGLVAEWGSAALLTHLVGSGHAADLLLSGRIVDAEEALGIGLVQKVLPGPELLPAAQQWARDVAGNCSPYSHRVMKQQLRPAGVEEHFAESMSLMLESFTRPDLAEALAARAEGRPPAFPAP